MLSDTCGSQNRNQNDTAVVMYAVQAIDHIHTIEQKFLEKGHTDMECSCMHSSIEYARKNTSVFFWHFGIEITLSDVTMEESVQSAPAELL